MEPNLNQARKILKEAGIEYSEYTGMSEFRYTALVFNSRKKAWKAYELLGLIGVGPLKDNSIQFFG